MEKMILTTNLSDGTALKEKLNKLDNMFFSMDCHTDITIRATPKTFENTKYIFSTWNMPCFSEKEIKLYFPSLVAVFYAAGTVKYFAKPFINCDVKVFSAAIANAIPVAEFVVAQILLANKGYFQAQKEYKKPFWKLSFNKARSYSFNKKGNYKAKIGIIGCGAIGSKIVSILKSYELEVFVYDPFLSEKRVLELGVQKYDLIDVFTNCDVITNHLPDIADTKGMINYKLLSLMKDNATFINTGRGAQVVEKDLVKVMSMKPKACALLDVTHKEPIRPWSSLLRQKNIFMTPHIAGSVSDEVDRMVYYMFIAYKNTLEGRKDTCEVEMKELNKQT